MSSFCINYLSDKQDIIIVLQFIRGDQGTPDVNRLVGCIKNVIAGQREEAEGEVDVPELDRAPVFLFQTNVETMKSDMNVLSSRSSTDASKAKCHRLAEAGPRDVLAEVLPLYISQCAVINNELRYKGTVMRYENNMAALYSGEPQKAHEIELLVTLFFPELNRSTGAEAKVE